MWIALVLATTALLPPQEPVTAPLELEIDAVTLYRSSAMVHRRAREVTSGHYLVSGLPGELTDADTRVRFIGGHVVAVELRERVVQSVPAARLEALRSARAAADLALREARDGVAIANRSLDFHAQLYQAECAVWSRQLASGAAETERWAETREWFEAALLTARTERRGALERQREAERVVADFEEELGRLTRSGGVLVKDLHLRLVTEHASGRLEVDTRLPAAGWEPVYDLRASDDARDVDLSYRARVHQHTGEDWNDVRVLLSTAQPELGAQGPDPIARWVDLVTPYRGYASGSIESAAPASEAWSDDDALGVAAYDSEVIEEGLSVRFELPRRETIESRDAPTTVLVAEERLAVDPEYYCAPALATTVWLRGRATNTGERTLLPGEASLFFGDDFLGRSRLDLVQPGQEFTLHLGAVTAIEVERTRVHDRAEGPGFFGSKRAQVEEWLVQLTNHGASIAAPDGSVDVIVQEALPRAADEGVEVVVENESPKHSRDERWKTDLEDRSIRTWVVHAPRGTAGRLSYRVSVRYPKNRDVYVEGR